MLSLQIYYRQGKGDTEMLITTPEVAQLNRDEDELSTESGSRARVPTLVLCNVFLE